MRSLVLEYESRHDQNQDEGDDGQANEEIANLRIMFEQVESAKEIVPIVTGSISAQKGEEAGLRVCCVHAYVQEVMAQPEQGNLSARPVGMNQKVPHEQRGQQDLHQRPPGNTDELTEKAEEEVSCLVNQQVGVVQQSVVVPVQNVVDAKGQ